jgi:hypothetical protein
MTKASIRGFSNTDLVGRGAKIAKIGKFAEKYAGKAALVLTIAAGAFTTIKGIRDNNNKEIARGIVGTMYAIGGGYVGGEVGMAIGTAIMPGIGTAVGGLIGGIGGSLLGTFTVEKLLIEHIN